ncbi:MAG: FlgD immunoglobulin-like domain containing protein, partial [Gaiellaceae bacterium]
GTTTANAVVGATYENVGWNGPYIASVVNPGDSAHPWKTETEGWDIWDARSRNGLNLCGRTIYMYQVFANVFGSMCTVMGTPIVGQGGPCLVDVSSTDPKFVDFVGDFTNNPLRSGVAVVRFGLAQADRVQVMVYDVSGRQIRKLADRLFTAGEHTLTWDGVNDQGRLMQRGVYFTQVKYVNRKILNARKLTLLK